MALIDRARWAVRAVGATGVALALGLVTPAPAGADGLEVQAFHARLGTPRTTVLVQGRYTCGPFTAGIPDRGVIDFTVTQTRGGTTLTAYGYLEPTVCDGTSQPFGVAVIGVTDRPFRVGPATVSASGYVEGDGELQHSGFGPDPIPITRVSYP